MPGEGRVKAEENALLKRKRRRRKRSKTKKALAVTYDTLHVNPCPTLYELVHPPSTLTHTTSASESPPSSVATHRKISFLQPSSTTGCSSQRPSPSINGSTRGHSSSMELCNPRVPVPINRRCSRSQFVSLDCEMVGVTERKLSGLGRCSIVDYEGRIIFDEFIKPNETITDYRTRWSGIKPKHMIKALPIETALQKIYDLLATKIIIGHSLSHDFRVLKLDVPEHRLRDTVSYVPIRVAAKLPPNKWPSLKTLSARLLKRVIQKGSHCSVVDARAALDIYKLFEDEWEDHVSGKRSCWLRDRYWPGEVSSGLPPHQLTQNE